MLLFVIALIMLLFKQQAKLLLDAIIKLIVALADALVKGIK